ncbi:unnamed protein product, partial [Mesorhabditis belari]|uniref:Prolyl endopeptidase n=1 Tax=Mesorhabditis belari TaxID=2138241 RepID=A0AAF3FIM5_9BILA
MPAPVNPSVYPTAKRDETVFDDYHGTRVADPYRWMEDPDGEATQKWVDELNGVSEPFIKKAPSREKMREKLTATWDYEKFTNTSKRGQYYYFWHNTGLQNQYVIYQSTKPEEKGKVFLDVNKLSEDGTTSIRIGTWSEDGKTYAYGISEKGSDWMTIKFRNNDGTDLPDVISGVKHSGLDWMHDGSGVFYCRYPDHKGAEVGTSVEKHEFHSLYFHRMGTDSKDDVLVYDDRRNPDYMIGSSLSEDGRFLFLDISRGCDPYNMLYYVDLEKNGPIKGKLDSTPLFDKLDAKYSFIDNTGDDFLIQTNKDAPMYKLIRINAKDPSNQEVVIEENKKNKLEWASPCANDRLLVCYLEDVKTTLYAHDLKTGDQLYQFPLDIGTISGCFAKKDETEMYLSFESFLTPTVVYALNFKDVPLEKAPEIKLLRQTTLSGVNLSNFETRQVFFNSKDGTKVPMFIVSRKDLVLDGNNPTLLNGYGGFNISDLPAFSVTRLCFAQGFNGVVAVANIRGGGEYGEDWHKGGMKGNKQNVFDDFQAAAEYLLENKYTNPTKLAIQGGSNGGLLMGACSQQRPELYGAVINRVGVLDMLRFHKFTIGGAWVPEFGNPDEKEDFPYIYKYSPLHNIAFPKAGQWPSTLLMTADHDDRVVPSHTLKYMAELYHKAKQHPDQQNPLLARIEVKAGHGAGKPTSKIIAEYVDIEYAKSDAINDDQLHTLSEILYYVYDISTISLHITTFVLTVIGLRRGFYMMSLSFPAYLISAIDDMLQMFTHGILTDETVTRQFGFVDITTIHKFTIGGAWVPEFGKPDEKEDFPYIYKYSPLHNIAFPKAGQWPSTLLMTADHDDRVVPSHTLKYMAELYHKIICITLSITHFIADLVSTLILILDYYRDDNSTLSIYSHSFDPEKRGAITFIMQFFYYA